MDLGSSESSTSDPKFRVLRSFSSADSQNITLENGDLQPVSSTLEELHIRTNKGKEFTQEQVIGLLLYGTQCGRLNTLLFKDCLLPLSFPSDSLSSIQRLASIKVLWQPSGTVFKLAPSMSKWVFSSLIFIPLEFGVQYEDEDLNSLRSLCSSVVTLERTDSKHHLRCKILLLEIASCHNVPIKCVYLSQSFVSARCKPILILSPASSTLSALRSMKELWISHSEILLIKELKAILFYSSQCTSLNELRLELTISMPDNIPVESIPASLKLREVKVLNNLEHSSRRLNLETGEWQACDRCGNLPGNERESSSSEDETDEEDAAQ